MCVHRPDRSCCSKCLYRLIGDTIGRYAINVLLSVDQLGNSILGGDPDETISSRLGRIKVKYGGTIPARRPISRITAAVLDLIDPGHTLDAIEHDQGHDGIFDRPPLDPKPPPLDVDKPLPRVSLPGQHDSRTNRKGKRQ